MSNSQKENVYIVHESGNSRLSEVIGNEYLVSVFESVADLSSINSEAAVVILDLSGNASVDYVASCHTLKSFPSFEDVPVIHYFPINKKVDTMSIFDAGSDDILDDSMTDKDLVARIQKIIFHTVANRQLKSRLKQANEMAFSAMSDTSDLGVNIQFLIHCHDCNNVDELGMLLFRTLQHYQLKCSVQIRSDFEVKNIEENGLAKDLESRLLWELKEDGRYVDFGSRSVMNYGHLSLLVKNMPEDERRYGSIKDNVFALLQGADARVKSIDNSRMLEMERDVLRGMSVKMQNVMGQVDNRYQSVMRSCAELVEDMALKVDESILFLDLTEAQEATFSSIMQGGVGSVNQLFNEGIKIDESFRKLIDYLNGILATDEHTSVEQLKSVLDKL